MASSQTAKSASQRRRKQRKLLSTEAFVVKAQAVHGDLYDYSRAEYRGSLELLTILCRVHGPFRQKPNNHIHGRSGCPACAEERRLTAISTMSTDRFIARSREINGDSYTYEKTEYAGYMSKLTMTCRQHGDFQQTPNNHLLSKAGCPRCGADARYAAQRRSTERFIADATAVHGDAYDYSRVEYDGVMTKVTIVCVTHGPFDQSPNGHLRGQGCWECWVDGRRLDRDEFVTRAAVRFSGVYDYSRVPDGWVPTRSRVTIICRRHGEFVQIAGEHLRGSGCIACAGSRPESEIRNLLESAGVRFEYQWGHPTLRYKGPLRIDFMLPDSKTLIEYDGAHHFKPMSYRTRSAEENLALFEAGRVRDRIKDEWAAANGWTLLRISGRCFERDLVNAGILPGRKVA